MSDIKIDEMAEAAHANSAAHGFWDDVFDMDISTEPYILPAKLMLIVSEAAEALEAHREGGVEALYHTDERGKPEGVPAELADILVRVGDLYERWRRDVALRGLPEQPTLGEAVEAKMAFNATRSRMHGKVC